METTASTSQPNMKKGVYQECPSCGTTYYREAAQVKNGIKKVCSLKCRVYTSERMKHVGSFNIGRTPWNKGTVGIMKPNRGSFVGFGKTNEDGLLRKSQNYRIWRKSVFERDGYACVECGQVGGRLNADHIKPWSLFPELRFEIENGRTMCEPCHRMTDTFGIKSVRISRADGSTYFGTSSLNYTA
jgi:hypothetical protein